MANQTSPLLRLSAEMQVLIAEQLDTPDLRNFRMANRELAAAGHGELSQRVRTHISSGAIQPYNCRQPKFLADFVQDVQTCMPQGAARVEELMLTRSPAFWTENIGTQLGDLRLPKLHTLVLKGLTIDAASLQKFLETHRHSLKTMNLTELQLTSTDLTKQQSQPEARTKLWKDMCEFIKSNLQLDAMVVKMLSWATDEYPGSLIEFGPIMMMPKMKYHSRYLGSDLRQMYKLQRFGVVASGADGIKEGIEAFLKDVRYRAQSE
ncbi:hypothetical protein LTR08_000348 [Meristemomyces frigidus]|nr:hypothetical protein LTR08_000348 [Meristemomyces frigidus]